jgi:UDP-N-acetylglucosamine 2-epimerase (non-hydrolysing)
MPRRSHIVFVVGARPNFMKIAPVYRALQPASLDVTLLHTGQHYDRVMSDVFFDDLELPTADIQLNVGSGTHAEQTARALQGIAGVLERDRPDLVVVAGDVNSTLAGALAAVKLNLPVAHVEAGLRSWDWAMPEEHNRRLTDHVSKLLFAHCSEAVENLRAEGIGDDDRTFLVGNTMIDSLRRGIDAARAAAPWATYGLAAGNYGLVTLHRPALVDDPKLLSRTMSALAEISAHMPVLFPVHPRTRSRLVEMGLNGDQVEGVILSQPAPYVQFLGLEASAAFVVTDSGGVQEETSALGVPCFTLRDSTERSVTVESGTNTLLGLDPDRIRAIPTLLREFRPPTASIPLWDGNAGERIASILTAHLAQGRALAASSG